MIAASLQDATHRKLLRIAASALPVDADPIGSLARGFRVDRATVNDLLQGWQREGIVSGVWGEPNPIPGSGIEALAARFEAASPVVRWRAESSEGAMESQLVRGALPDGAWPAIRLLKAGLPLDLDTDGAERLLHPTEDRTLMVGGEERAQGELSEAEEAMRTALAEPMPIDPSNDDLWSQVGSRCGLEGERARLVARQLVLRRVWRRFCLRVAPWRAGWRGTGLAVWEFGDEPMALQAGSALASLRGTGDVALRGPAAAGGSGFAVTALVMGREDGAGEQAACTIANQWNRPLARWIPFGLH